MVEGDSHFVALSWSPLPPPRTIEEADVRLRRTSEHWRQWITLGDFPDHPWRSYLQRSALTLKGLTYAPTGALIAAATTSLPETPGGERNWDYRYAWVRDSTFALWGLYTLGFDREADDFFYFVARRVPRRQRPAGDVRGRRRARAGRGASLPHLSGYEGAFPVRDRQRRLLAAPARRVGRRARLGLPARALPRAAAGVAVAGTQAPGRAGGRALGGAGPRHLGGARRAAALHLQQADVLGGPRPRRPAGPDARRAAVRREVADARRPDPRRHLRERRRRPRRVRPALRRRRAGRVRCC